MDRLKTFKWYFIIFVSLFLIFNLLTYGVMLSPNKELKYEIIFDSPKMVVTDAKTTYSSGYIKGEITNNTGDLIDLKYLKFEFYNDKGTYLGTKYKELKYFYANETMKVDMEYNYKNVEAVKISFSDEQVERELTKFEKEIKKWWPIVGVITLIYVLP